MRKPHFFTNKFLLKSEKGFSLMELLIMVVILIAVTGLIFLLTDPVAQQKRNRDNRRILELSILAQAIESFYSDNNRYPDNGARTATRESDSLPVGNSGPVEVINGNGWVDESFGDRLEKLPTDPLNTGCSVYRYRQSANGRFYKLDAVLEAYTSKMGNSEDGGQDSSHYEVGNATAANPVNMGSCS